MSENQATLDTRGLKCPLPVLRARKRLKDLPPGGLLEVLATDPDSPRDFANFCETTGDQLVESSQTENAEYRFVIRRKP